VNQERKLQQIEQTAHYVQLASTARITAKGTANCVFEIPIKMKKGTKNAKIVPSVNIKQKLDKLLVPVLGRIQMVIPEDVHTIHWCKILTTY